MDGSVGFLAEYMHQPQLQFVPHDVHIGTFLGYVWCKY